MIEVREAREFNLINRVELWNLTLEEQDTLIALRDYQTKINQGEKQ